MKNERMFFLLTKQQKEFLKRTGEKKDRTASYILRKLIDEAMEHAEISK